MRNADGSRFKNAVGTVDGFLGFAIPDIDDCHGKRVNLALEGELTIGSGGCTEAVAFGGIKKCYRSVVHWGFTIDGVGIFVAASQEDQKH